MRSQHRTTWTVARSNQLHSLWSKHSPSFGSKLRNCIMLQNMGKTSPMDPILCLTFSKHTFLRFILTLSLNRLVLRGNALDLHFGCAQFKTWPGYWLAWGFSWLSQVPPGKCHVSTLIRSWLLPSKSFPIHHHSRAIVSSNARKHC
jgi:hypothetical protein